MFNLFNLNFACLAVAFRFMEDTVPEVLTVAYNNHGVAETRIPGGTVIFEDFIKSIEKISDDKKYESINFTELIAHINKVHEIFKQDIARCRERHEKNKVLNYALYNLSEDIYRLHPGGPELVQQISDIARQETLTRKLIIETGASKVGTIIPISMFRLGQHEKCGFVSVEIEAPDMYHGSADNDIWLSQWKAVRDVYKKLFVSQSANHKNLLQEGIRKVIEMKLHPRAEELREYWTSHNPI